MLPGALRAFLPEPGLDFDCDEADLAKTPSAFDRKVNHKLGTQTGLYFRQDQSGFFVKITAGPSGIDHAAGLTSGFKNKIYGKRRQKNQERKDIQGFFW